MRRARFGIVLAVILALGVAGWPGAALAENELGGGVAGQTTTLSQIAAQLQQVTQTIQQLSATLQQVVSTVSNQAVGTIMRTLGLPSGVGLPGGGGIPSGPAISVTSWLSPIEQWLAQAVPATGNSVWSEWGAEWGQAPDYAYNASVGSQLSQIAGRLTGQAQQWVVALVQRLLGAPQPPANSPQSAATAIAQVNPDFAARAHSVQQSQVSAIAGQATAVAAAEQATRIAQEAASDQTPQLASQDAQAVAQTAIQAVQSAPSTRAAVEVMAAALAQQMADQVAALAAQTARLDALLAQQASIATSLSQAVAGLGTVSGLLAQQIEADLDAQAQQATLQGQALGSATKGIGDELRFIGSDADRNSLATMLDSLRSLTGR